MKVTYNAQINWTHTYVGYLHTTTESQTVVIDMMTNMNIATSWISFSMLNILLMPLRYEKILKLFLLVYGDVCLASIYEKTNHAITKPRFHKGAVDARVSLIIGSLRIIDHKLAVGWLMSLRQLISSVQMW